MKYDEEHEKIIEKVTDHRYIPPNKIRFLEREFYKMFLLGCSVNEIAEKLNYTTTNVRIHLKSPAVQREIKRLERMLEKELVKLVLRPLKELYSHWEEEGKELLKKIKGRKPILGRDKAILFLKRFEKIKNLGRERGGELDSRYVK